MKCICFLGLLVSAVYHQALIQQGTRLHLTLLYLCKLFYSFDVVHSLKKNQFLCNRSFLPIQLTTKVALLY